MWATPAQLTQSAGQTTRTTTPHTTTLIQDMLADQHFRTPRPTAGKTDEDEVAECRIMRASDTLSPQLEEYLDGFLDGLVGAERSALGLVFVSVCGGNILILLTASTSPALLDSDWPRLNLSYSQRYERYIGQSGASSPLHCHCRVMHMCERVTSLGS